MYFQIFHSTLRYLKILQDHILISNKIGEFEIFKFFKYHILILIILININTLRYFSLPDTLQDTSRYSL